VVMLHSNALQLLAVVHHVLYAHGKPCPMHKKALILCQH
jgi:hypothetical protein